MTRDQIEELASLQALGALDGDDVAAWDRVRAENSEASRLGDELTDIAARLSLLASEATAPSALRQQVMDRVFGSESLRHPVDVNAQHFAFGAWAAAAAVILLVVVGASSTTRQKESVVVRDMRAQPQSLHIPLSGYGEYAGVKASVLWDSGQRGWYVQADGLPSLPESHRYRVWAVDAAGALHDCGELPLHADGCARRFVQPGDAIQSMQGFAVSIEPSGSAPSSPSTPAVLISESLQG